MGHMGQKRGHTLAGSKIHVENGLWKIHCHLPLPAGVVCHGLVHFHVSSEGKTSVQERGESEDALLLQLLVMLRNTQLVEEDHVLLPKTPDPLP